MRLLFPHSIRRPKVLAAAISAITGLALLSGNLSSTAAFAQASSSLNRPADPVVLTGADIPSLNGIVPNELVAFRFADGWQQIPVQVDERALVDFGAMYNHTPTGIQTLAYSDPNTFTGADPNATLDANDEIAFMAKDAGVAAADASEPAGVVARSGVQLAISDPLALGDAGYVYLFRKDGTLDPSAGQQYVSYKFNLLSGDYRATYNLAAGPNPENSAVRTATYQQHFSDRWIDDELRITAGGATGADILDRHKSLFAPGSCTRSEDTFSTGEGAFVVNKSGPVRAIRSYLGANSGPSTQREHIFYAARQDITTFLRVHSIPGLVDFFDYSPAASGMRYVNNLNPAGALIDGVPDTVLAGPLQWELVAGAQGSLVQSYQFTTNIPNFTSSSYYLDAAKPRQTQCTGDRSAYGSSGAWIKQTIPCTDPIPAMCPTTTPVFDLSSRRTLYYGAPGLTAADAQSLNAQAAAPLTYAASPWEPAAVPAP